MTDEQGRILAGAVMVLCGCAASAIAMGPSRASVSPAWMARSGLKLIGHGAADVVAGEPLGPILDITFAALAHAFGEKP